MSSSCPPCSHSTFDLHTADLRPLHAHAEFHPGEQGSLLARTRGQLPLASLHLPHPSQLRWSLLQQSRPVTLVDVPGEERVRDRILAKYRKSLWSALPAPPLLPSHTITCPRPLLPSALVVVVDSVAMSQLARSVAELVFDLLSERPVHRGSVPLLVACNKQDLALAWSCDAVRRELEREM